MHRYLSTDYGVECFACGLALDYLAPDDGDASPSLVTDERTELEAMRFLPDCPGPITERSHHYVYEVDRISCAYGDQTIDLDTRPLSVRHDCWGDEAPRETLMHRHAGGRIHNHAWWGVAEMTDEYTEHEHAYRPDWT
jgi:hypothetical protein